MRLESLALPDSMHCASWTRSTDDWNRLPVVRRDLDVDQHLQELVDAAHQLRERSPLAVAELRLALRLIDDGQRDLVVLGDCLGEERVLRQMVDQVEQEAPLTPAPELS